MKYVIEIQRWVTQSDGITQSPTCGFYTGQTVKQDNKLLAVETGDLYEAKLYGNKGAATYAIKRLRAKRANWLGLYIGVAGVSDELCKEIELRHFAVKAEGRNG